MPRAPASLLWILLAPLVGCGAGEDLIAPTSGALEVITATANPPTDLGAYTIFVDGVLHSIGPTDTLTLPGLSAANHEVELAELPESCTTEGTNPRFVALAPNATTRVLFQVLCPDQSLLADLQVSVATAGSAPDPDGYSLLVDEQAGRPVGVNEALTLTGLAPGIHHLRLADIASNCEVHDANPRVIDVPQMVETSFAVTCVPSITGAILYSSDRDNTEGEFNHDIFLRDVDGRSIRNLTNTPFEDERVPVWSPDGLQIAFVPVDGTGIFVMNADGSDRRLLVGGLDIPVFTDVTAVQWSPDGSRILFMQFNADFAEELTTYSFSTNQLEVLARPPSFGLTSFCWSHDGARVAYSTVDFGTTPRTAAVYTVSTAGGAPVAISRASRADQTVHAWSPDGGTIAYVQEEIDLRSDIYLVPADGSAPPTNLTARPGSYRDVTWSPDGQTLAFNNEGLFSITRTGVLRQLTAEEAEDISWSKDGSRLLFEEGFELYLINFDGTGRRAITADGFLNSEASWRP